MIFDGRGFAREIEERLREQVGEREHKPKIVSILVGNDPSSELYTRLKKQAAERCGIGFEIYQCSKIPMQQLREKVQEIGQREDVTGMMIQLPIPGLSQKETEQILQEIPLDKDVDGLIWEQSGVAPATVRAILTILERIRGDVPDLWQRKFAVIGAKGAVGRPLVQYLRERGVQVVEVGRNTPEPTRSVLVGQVVISCVGKAGLVTGEMVQDGVIVVDVGMSEINVHKSQVHTNAHKLKNQQFENLRISDLSIKKYVGDMTQEVYQKASVAVAVPGGVGPVTVVSLLQNAVDLS